MATPSLAMTLGIYSERKRILTAVDDFYSENKKLPQGYADLIAAKFLTNSSPDTDFFPYLEFKNISDTQVDVCLKFKADTNRPDEPQCQSYLVK